MKILELTHKMSLEYKYDSMISYLQKYVYDRLGKLDDYERGYMAGKIDQLKQIKSYDLANIIIR